MYFELTFEKIKKGMNFYYQYIMQNRNATLNENMIASHINAKIFTQKLGCKGTMFLSTCIVSQIPMMMKLKSLIN